MRKHSPDLKIHILNWYKSNRESLEQYGATNDVLADAYIRKFPDTLHSWETVKKYITKVRAGEITEQIRVNIREAERGFGQVDKDPLGVLQPDIKQVFFDVPESYANYKAPLKLDGYGKRMGVVSDIHFPIHDRSSVLAAHSFLKKSGIDFLLLLGDIMDCSNLTRHSRRKTLSYTWREELEVGRAYIKSLRVLFPDIPIVYAEGNHENWLQQYIINQARNIEGDYILRERLGLSDHNIEWVEEDRLMTYGKLFLHHGHKMGFSGGRNIASRLLDKHGVNLMVGHWHKQMNDDKRTLDEVLHGAWVNGCLADLHPDYNPHNNSTHGVAVVDLLGDGMFNVSQHKIVDGRVIGE